MSLNTIAIVRYWSMLSEKVGPVKMKHDASLFYTLRLPNTSLSRCLLSQSNEHDSKPRRDNTTGASSWLPIKLGSISRAKSDCVRTMWLEIAEERKDLDKLIRMASKG
jgi:hypothetical protein